MIGTPGIVHGHPTSRRANDDVDVHIDALARQLRGREVVSLVIHGMPRDPCSYATHADNSRDPVGSELEEFEGLIARLEAHEVVPLHDPQWHRRYPATGTPLGRPITISSGEDDIRTTGRDGVEACDGRA